MQDQDFLCAQFDIKCPLPIDDSILLAEFAAEKNQKRKEQMKYRYYPTSAMYNRQSNFMRMDLESLFFAFYYQQGTYQQYLAALELKQRGWEFHIRFQTWMKKEVTHEYTRGGKQ
jgi:CCR4-NOT transcription complex subunit 3